MLRALLGRPATRSRQHSITLHRVPPNSMSSSSSSDGLNLPSLHSGNPTAASRSKVLTSSSLSGYNIRARASASLASADWESIRSEAGRIANSAAAGVRKLPQRTGSASTGGRPGMGNRRSSTTTASNALTTPVPGHVRPVLLPTYAQLLPARDREPQTWTNVDAPEDLEDGEVEIFIRLKGFVERWPESRSTAQRIWERAGRQLAGLPKLPAQTGNVALEASVAQTPLATASSAVDDAVFFPEVPDAISSSSVGGRTASHSLDEGLPEKLAESMIEGASDAALEKLLGLGGVLPVEEAPDAHGERKIQRSNTGLTISPSASGTATPASGSATVPMVGGSSAWWGRSLVDLHSLTTTLDARLRAFWTYREAEREVRIEVVPIFHGDHESQLTWAQDPHTASLDVEDPPARLIAATRLTSDAAGMIDSHITIPKHMLAHYLKTDPDVKVQQMKPHQIKSVKLRAILMPSKHAATASESLFGQDESKREAVVGAWHTLSLQPLHPKRRNARAISDVDDTVRHSHVLGGARAVFRNVFVRPHAEVQIKGVREWYGALSDLGVGLHYVSNAPCELHSVVRDFLSSAGLPPGHLALKHYPAGSTSSLITSWLQPAGARKRGALLGILDDFPNDMFVLIGDSGEMDLEVYTEVALARPGRIAGIWIRDVSGTPAEIEERALQRKQEKAARDFSSSSTASTLAPPPKAATAAAAPETAPVYSTPSYPPPSRSNTSSSVASAASTSSTASSASESKSFPARLARSRASLPNSILLRTWREGEDAREECELLVKSVLAERYIK